MSKNGSGLGGDLFIPSITEIEDEDSQTIDFSVQQKLELSKKVNVMNIIKVSSKVAPPPPPPRSSHPPLRNFPNYQTGTGNRTSNPVLPPPLHQKSGGNSSQVKRNGSFNNQVQPPQRDKPTPENQKVRPPPPPVGGESWRDYSQEELTTQPIPNNPKLIYAHSTMLKNPCARFLQEGIRLEFRKDVIPDFIINRKVCVVYFRMMFYLKKTKQCIERLKRVQKLFESRIVLLMMEGNTGSEDVLMEFEKMSFRFDFSLIPVFSDQEAGRYLTIFKKYQFSSNKVIKEDIEEGHMPRVTSVLTTIRGLSKPNSKVLMNNFSSIRKVMLGKLERFQTCPGLGTIKCERMYKAFRTPFSRTFVKK